MVELQSHTQAFADAGIALYALSYDEVDALAHYAEGHAVSFPLLSDPNSEIIERFGILNTLIDPDDHPWHGIPFPGTYVTDADGIITAKFFENSLFFRPSADQLLRSALGEQVELTPTSAVEAVDVEVGFDGEVSLAGVLRDLVVRFRLPEGQHLYTDPVPEGLVATSVEIDEQVGLIVREPQLGATTPLTLAGSGDTLLVFDGEPVIRIPITHLGRSLVKRDDGARVLRITGTVRWQACDDDACGLPQTERFSIDIPAQAHNSPGPDTATHLGHMMGRKGDDRQLGEMFAAITGPDA